MLSTSQFRYVNPSEPGSAARIKPETWLLFRSLITRLHNEGCTKKEILARLDEDESARRHHFHPTMGQLIPQMKKWLLFADRRDTILFPEHIPILVDCREMTRESEAASDDFTAQDSPRNLDDVLGEIFSPLREQDQSSNSQSQPTVFANFVSTELQLDLNGNDETYQQESTFESYDQEAVGLYGSDILWTGPDKLDRSEFCDNTLSRTALTELPSRRTFDFHETSLDEWTESASISVPSSAEFSSIDPSCSTPSQAGSSLTSAKTSLDESPKTTCRNLETREIDTRSSEQNYSRPSSADSKTQEHGDTLFKTAHAYFACSGVLDKWLGTSDIPRYSDLQLEEMYVTAQVLAATRKYDDAFELFYLRFRCWVAALRYLPWVLCMQQVVSSAVNCARTCRPGSRQKVTEQMLLAALELLSAERAGVTPFLDSALLHLYLSIFLAQPSTSKDVLETNRRRGVQHLELAVKIVTKVNSETCTRLLPDIRSRELLFIRLELQERCIRKIQEGYLPDAFAAIWFYSPSTSFGDHLLYCRQAKGAWRLLLTWCLSVIQRSPEGLDRVTLQATDSSRTDSSPYAACVNTLIRYWIRAARVNPPMPCDSIPLRCPLNPNADQHPKFELDLPLAFAVIAERLCTRKVEPVSLGSNHRFSAHCISGAKTCMLDQNDTFTALTARYVRLVSDLPIEILAKPTMLAQDSSGVPDENMLETEKIITDRVILEEQDLFENASISRYAESSNNNNNNIRTTSGIGPASTGPSRNPSKASLRRSSLWPNPARLSVTASLKSSIHSIRSSMSNDYKNFVEGARRYRQSVLSLQSRDTRESNAISLMSEGSNAFDRVTGMPTGPLLEDPGPSSEQDVESSVRLWHGVDLHGDVEMINA